MLEEILREVKEMKYQPDGVADTVVDVMARCGFDMAKEQMKDIIRRHRNDGWIPCENELPGAWDIDPDLNPEDIIWPEYNVTIRNASDATTLYYDFREDTWFDGNGNLYDVVAWRPIPRAYCPNQRYVGEDYKQRIMDRFTKTE